MHWGGCVFLLLPEVLPVLVYSLPHPNHPGALPVLVSLAQLVGWPLGESPLDRGLVAPGGGDGQMRGEGDGYKVRDGGGIKNKTDRCVMGEVGARVPSVPPSTQCKPLG